MINGEVNKVGGQGNFVQGSGNLISGNGNRVVSSVDELKLLGNLKCN